MLNVIKQWHEKITASYVWDEYVSSIKRDNRFIPPLKFQEYIKMLLDLKEVISDDKTFYRARLIKPSQYTNMNVLNSDGKTRNSGIFGLQRDNMNAPPKEMAGAGRANPEGISYLYLASNEQTACSEIRPVIFDIISVSRFKLVKRLTIINLNNIDLKAYEGIERIKRKSFLEKVMISFALPINERNAVEYAPTQYIAAYLKANGIDGIKYFSFNDLKSRSYNIVLFNPDNAKCIDDYGKVYRCVKKQMTFQDISTYDKKSVTTTADMGLLGEVDIRELNNKLQMNIKNSTKKV